MMQREQLEVDVLFVGAGPACLSAAFYLSRLVSRHDREVEAGTRPGPPLGEQLLLVVEKGKEIGSHALSGAIVDPRAFRALLQGLPGAEPPLDAPVRKEDVLFLTKRKHFRLPVIPPPLHNEGNHVASLGKLVKWLAGLCQDHEVEVYPEFPAVKLLLEGDRVVGARMGDRGLDAKGRPRSHFEPGTDVLAKITVLGEGPRGTLTRQAEEQLGLDRDGGPQLYSLGVKEVWRVPGIEPGRVCHTLGYPTGTREFGGGFIYTLTQEQVHVGFVVGLDSRDPREDAHRLLQEYKQHPFVRRLLEGGRVVSYGAKAIPEGGYHCMPRAYADGLLLVGDSAGFLNPARLKGIHLAIESGMMAAEAAFEALVARDCSAERLKRYAELFEASEARNELHSARNFRQSFQRGFWTGVLYNGLQTLTGLGWGGIWKTVPGHERMEKVRGSAAAGAVTEPADGELTFDKLSDVYLSDTAHEEDQPSHLKISDLELCRDRCREEYGNPCQHFCPAGVYEMVQDGDRPRLQVNFTNCVHCKTCDILDPYQVILWTPPEGGGGPDYKNM